MAHNIEEAKVMCNLIAIINERNIVASYTPEFLKKTIHGTQSIAI